MSLIIQENYQQHSTYAVWKIEEDDSFYLSKLILSESEKKFLKTIHHPKQKTRWFASRFLLKYLMKTNSYVELLIDLHGKPFLANYDLNLSISHSDNYAAVIISKSHEVGIDIEHASRNIEILKNKFLSNEELQELEKSSEMQASLLIYWAAKEVMYKIYGKRKLEFKDHLYIKPFVLNLSGQLNGELSKNDLFQMFEMEYKRVNDFILVIGNGEAFQRPALNSV